MCGTRGIWQKGWKAATEHGPMPSNQGNFDKDRWQLFRTDEYMSEAKKNNVLPLNDVDAATIHEMEFHQEAPASGRYAYYPGTTEVPESSAARTLGASFKALAEVEFTKDTQGVIFAQGSRFGGYSLFVKDGKLIYVCLLYTSP